MPTKLYTLLTGMLHTHHLSHCIGRRKTKQKHADTRFHAATQLENLLSLFLPELNMPAFQTQSLIDTLMQRVDQLHPRARDEYLCSSTSPTFVFTDEDLQLKAYTNGATALTQHLYDYVCKVISEWGDGQGDAFIPQPNGPYLAPKTIRLVLQTLADILHCDIFIHPDDVAKGTHLFNTPTSHSISSEQK